ncbi:class F sortase [Streptomyces sp. M10(2022)]
MTVPAIGLKVTVDPVGLDASGTISLPQDADHAGWYTGSPTPGGNGNTILVGHVDSTTDRPPLRTRSREERRPDRGGPPGRPHSGVCSGVDVHLAPGRFPSERVYGPTTGPQLTLLTCADWDKDSKTYVSNLVITAQPAPPQPPA